MFIIRAIKIFWVIVYFQLDEFLDGHSKTKPVRCLFQGFFFWRPKSRFSRADRLRLALESLGPIFVKFGQALSTRRDLLPEDLADSLAKLQDQVPPFDGHLAQSLLEDHFHKPILEVFSSFDITPIASASVAQVHFATLPDGKPVAIKILRPNIHKVINKDVRLMDSMARLVEGLFPKSRRFHPIEIVAEFDKHLKEELDLIIEASKASQLGRNFADKRLLIIPEVYWDYCGTTVMVMERMFGTPISQTDVLINKGIDLAKLGRDGVEIFFTQVFRDGFFHADMHPGNIQVADDGRYVGLDFGIVGTLTDTDKNYLAQNFLAFFRRDYRRVAMAHIEAGWVPSDTRADEFESAIRSVCEPIFDKPISEISFGKVLLRLFQVSRRFNMEVQPQLVLLQKTLLNVEGLGRQLDPNLDLWKTAKPFLERWMSEQIGWRGLWKTLKNEGGNWVHILPEIPRLAHQALIQSTQPKELLQQIQAQQKQLQSLQRWLMMTLLTLGILLGVTLAHWPIL